MRRQKHENLSLITTSVNTRQGTLYLTTDDNLLTAYVYVGFRKQDPDEKTWKDVLKLLKKNNINVNEMLDWKPVDCQLAQSSKGSVTSA